MAAKVREEGGEDGVEVKTRTTASARSLMPPWTRVCSATRGPLKRMLKMKVALDEFLKTKGAKKVLWMS